MAESGSDSAEKTEEATPYKLQEARKQGNVFKSMEVNTALAMVVALLLVASLGEGFVKGILGICRSIFLSMGEIDFTVSDISFVIKYWITSVFHELSPIVAALTGVGVIASFVQVGVIFSAQPLSPKFSRLDPIAGFKNRFSKKMLWETLKTILKFSVLSSIAFFWLLDFLPSALKYSSMQPAGIFKDFLLQSANLLWQLTAAFIVIAILDFFQSRREYLKKMRMSKQELTDEFKRRDGDPNIKFRRRELEAELRKRSASLNNVQAADVVVTNPTHFAVVLKYDRLTMLAPIIVGLGAGNMAKAIRERAVTYGVPVIHMPQLARQLFKSGRMEHPIPQDCFVATAKVLGQAYAVRRKSALEKDRKHG
jgi:flagellar biosynthesis protein FlhB